MPKHTARAYRHRIRWTAEDAREALAALDASGLSTTAFARREGIDAQRLYWWRRRVSITRRDVVSTPQFVELAPAGGSDLVEVALRSGRVLRFSAAIDAASLRRIVNALDEDSSC